MADIPNPTDGTWTPEGGPGYNPNELKSLRPNLRQAHWRCQKCRKQPDMWTSYALHIGGRGGELLSGRGAIHGQIKCHGDVEEVLIPFENAHAAITSGEKLPCFDQGKPFEVSRIIKPGDTDLIRLREFNG